MTAEASIPTRPLVRYHGGKWNLAPKFLEHFPKHRCYVEPFGGGGSILIRKPRVFHEVYNDLDGEMVGLFYAVRDHGDDLRRRLALTPFARREFALSYQPSADPMEQARRTVVRAFQGFGSAAVCGAQTGFRAHSKRSGTTPAQDWSHFADCLPALTARLQGVVLENKPAAEIIAREDDPTALQYIDPPYVLSSRSTMRNGDCGKGYRFEMTDPQHEQLAEQLHGVKSMVVLSGYHTPLYDRLYADWERKEFRALADGAAARVEVLWFNPAAWDAIHAGQLPLS